MILTGRERKIYGVDTCAFTRGEASNSVGGQTIECYICAGLQSFYRELIFVRSLNRCGNEDIKP